MPKETFFNLSEEKRNKILMSAKKEFSRVPFSESSVKNIIEDAGIPRGSFYQYFENMEDLITYVVGLHKAQEDKQMQELLIKNNGDIFDTVKDIFENALQKNKEMTNKIFYQNIFETLAIHEKEINPKLKEEMKKCRKEKYKKHLNLNHLDLSEEDIDIIMSILFTISRAATIQVFTNCQPEELVRQKLYHQIEFLRKSIT